MAHLLRKYVIAPTNVDQYSACSQKKERKTLFIVGGDVLDAPKKTNGENKQYGGEPHSLIKPSGAYVRATGCLTPRKKQPSRSSKRLSLG